MRQDYKTWLERQGYENGTIVAQLHRTGRLEEHYGDLDTHFERDRLQQLIEDLTY
jgi:endonuclease